MADMGLVGMGGAAGAGDALAQIQQQRMQAAQLAQQDALTRLKFQEMAQKAQSDLEVKRQTEADRAEAAKSMIRQRMDAQLSQIPPTTPISAGTQQGMVGAGILPERFTPVPMNAPAPPPGIAAPSDSGQPEAMPGTAANAPGPMQFTRTPTPQEAAGQKLLALYPIGSKERAAAEYEIGTGKNAPSFMNGPKPGVIHDTPQGLMRIGEDNSVTPIAGPGGKPMQGYHAPVQPAVTVVQGPNGPMLVDKRGGTAAAITDKATGEAVGPKESQQTQTQRTNATNVLAHLDEINQEADQINKLGLMGPVGGRWADFMAGRIGAGDLAAGDPAAAELLGKFRADVGLLKSGMAMVHGGARGGGSAAIMARMDALINSNKMDLSLFKGATSSFKSWLNQYAKSGTRGASDGDMTIEKWGRDANGNPVKLAK